MKRFLPIALHACLLILLSCSLLPAAEPGPEQVIEQGVVYDEHMGIERPYIRIRGSVRPTYRLVESFFYYASGALDPPADKWSWLLGKLGIEPGSGAEAALAEDIGGPAYRWLSLLKKLSIEPGSEAEAALERAVLEAREWVLYSEQGTPLPACCRHPVETDEDHLVNQRLQVKHLATIYARLLVEFERSGCQVDKLLAYLEEGRTGGSRTSYPDPSSPLDLEALVPEAIKKFDQLVVEALATEGAPEPGDGGE